jgi:hypothetical protein
MDTTKMTPGFTMSTGTRPIAIGKFQEAVQEQGITIHSIRLLEEMKVFIWRNGRAEAQSGYNDDLVMSCAMGCYLRETAFKLRQRGMDMTRSILNNISTNTSKYSGGYSSTTTVNQNTNNPYKIDNPYSNGQEDISWLL